MSPSQKYKKSVRPILLGGRSLSYECTRKKMKSVTVRIRDGRVLVSAPQYVSFTRIEEFLRERQDFILRAVDTTLAREAEKQEAFVCRDGARVPWMGEEYTLRFTDKGSSRIEGGEMILSLKKTEDEEKRREALKRFAEKCLRAYAEERWCCWLWCPLRCLPFIHWLTLSVIIFFKMSAPLTQKTKSNQPQTELYPEDLPNPGIEPRSPTL